MNHDSNLALFLMLGQTASKQAKDHPDIADSKPIMLSDDYDLSTSLPKEVRAANIASETYKLFFIFENYIKNFVIATLSDNGQKTWWDKVPKDIQDEIIKLEDTEELKSWMSIGSRDKSALMTYPQLLRVIDHCWKDHFEDLMRDKALIQEARLISHLRNTICHMSSISSEEVDRIKQVIRDWFRVVAP
jgi:hypothetical protein